MIADQPAWTNLAPGATDAERREAIEQFVTYIFRDGLGIRCKGAWSATYLKPVDGPCHGQPPRCGDLARRCRQHRQPQASTQPTAQCGWCS
jgi:hypothetical protein